MHCFWQQIGQQLAAERKLVESFGIKADRWKSRRLFHLVQGFAPLLRTLHLAKAMTVLRSKVGPAFGRIDADALLEVERCLAVFLGIAK